MICPPFSISVYAIVSVYIAFIILLVSAGKSQKGKFKYFVAWDDDEFWECDVLSHSGSSVQVRAHDGDEGTYPETSVFKITDCPAKKGDKVIAYWDDRKYAFGGK